MTQQKTVSLWKQAASVLTLTALLSGCGGGSGGDGGTSPPTDPTRPETIVIPAPPASVPAPAEPKVSIKALTLITGSNLAGWGGCGDVLGQAAQARFAQIDNTMAFDEQGVLYMHEALPCDVSEITDGLLYGNVNLNENSPNDLRFLKKLSFAPQVTLEKMSLSGGPSDFSLLRVFGVHPRKDAIYFSAISSSVSSNPEGPSGLLPRRRYDIVGRVREGVTEILVKEGWINWQSWSTYAADRNKLLIQHISSSAMSAEGMLYVSDKGRIRKIDTQGQLHDDLNLAGFSLTTDTTGQVYVVNERFELVHADTGRILARHVPVNRNAQALDCLGSISIANPSQVTDYAALAERYPLYRCLTRIAFTSPTDVYAATDTVLYKLQKDGQWAPVLGAVGDRVYGRALDQIRALATSPQGELYMIENFGLYRVNTAELSNVSVNPELTSLKPTLVAGSAAADQSGCGDALGSATTARFKKGVYTLAADARGDLLLADTLGCGQSEVSFRNDSATAGFDNTVLGKKIASSSDFSVTTQAAPANWHFWGNISRITTSGDNTYFFSPYSHFFGMESHVGSFGLSRVWTVRNGAVMFLSNDGWQATPASGLPLSSNDLAVDAAGALYVNASSDPDANGTKSSVYQYSPQGKVIARYSLDKDIGSQGLSVDRQGQVHVLDGQLRLINLATQKVVAQNVPHAIPWMQRQQARGNVCYLEHLCKTHIAFTSSTDVYAASNNVLYKLQTDGQWKPVLGAAADGRVYGRVLNNLRTITATPQGQLYLMEDYALYRVDVK